MIHKWYQTEKRQEHRFRVKTGAFVEFSKPLFFKWGRPRIVQSASIVDISSSGLSFEYTASKMWEHNFKELAISVPADDVRIDPVPFESISDRIESSISASISKRRRVIRFVKLTHQLRSQIDFFRDNYAIDPLKEVIDWLMRMERLAYELYLKSSEIYNDNIVLSEFLKNLAEDESLHFHIMASAAKNLRNSNVKQPFLRLDKELKNSVESPLVRHLKRLSSGRVSEEALIDMIIEIEFSEFNDIFLYVVNTLKAEVKEFKYAALKIQNHKTSIENYLKSDDYGSKKLEIIKRLPQVSKEKILVVEDNQAASTLIKAIFPEGDMFDVVADGQEGLQKLHEDFYNGVIYEMDRPLVDMIEFYEQATEKFPDMKNRFVFLIENLSQDMDLFFTENKIRYSIKPVNMKEIREHISDLLLTD